MIADFADRDSDLCREVDVLVVGAGIAGLTLTTRLARKGLRVAVLESGGREQVEEVHPLNRVQQLGAPYHGGTHGRSRCLGGTSTRWGGALIPFVEHDFGARPYLNLPSFPVGMEEIRPYLGQVEAIFGVDSESYDEDVVQKIKSGRHVPIGDADFLARFAKWPIFKRRNLAVLFKEMIERDPKIEVWINATMTGFNFDKESGRIRSAEARNERGKKIVVAAKQFVVCAGAIESTRLLLLLNRQHNQRIFQNCCALGCFFYDHISAPVATLKAKQTTGLNRMAAFRFIGSTMRSLRFELSPAAQERERVGSAFGHIVFKTERSTGFDTLRSLLRSQQRNGRLQPALFLEAMRDLPYLANLVRWRVWDKQLLWPTPATYEFHVVVEQLPRSNNYITLATERDRFGLPMAAINWRVGPEEHKTFNVYMRCFDQYWKRHGLQALADLDWMHQEDASSADRLSGADVYHPGGSTRMGTDPHLGVVDSNLRSFAVDNLWVASTSVFPSGGGANPTLTLMLFTLRLADHLGSEVESLSSPVVARSALGSASTETSRANA